MQHWMRYIKQQLVRPERLRFWQLETCFLNALSGYCSAGLFTQLVRHFRCGIRGNNNDRFRDSIPFQHYVTWASFPLKSPESQMVVRWRINWSLLHLYIYMKNILPTKLNTRSMPNITSLELRRPKHFHPMCLKLLLVIQIILIVFIPILFSGQNRTMVMIDIHAAVRFAGEN